MYLNHPSVIIVLIDRNNDKTPVVQKIYTSLKNCKIQMIYEITYMTQYDWQ